MSPGSKRKKTAVTTVQSVCNPHKKKSSILKLEASSCSTVGPSSRNKLRKAHDDSKSVTAKLPQPSQRAGGSGIKKNDCTYNHQPKLSFSLAKKQTVVRDTNVLDSIPLHKRREEEPSYSTTRNSSVQKNKLRGVEHKTDKKSNTSSCNPLISRVKTLVSNFSDSQNVLTLVSASQIGKNAKKSSEHSNVSNRFCEETPQRIGKKDSLKFNRSKSKSEGVCKHSEVNHKQSLNEKVKIKSLTDKDVSSIGIKCHKSDSTSPILHVDHKRNSRRNVDYSTVYAKDVPLPSKKASDHTEFSASRAHHGEGLYVERSVEPCKKLSYLRPAVCKDKVIEISCVGDIGESSRFSDSQSTVKGRTSVNQPSKAAVEPGYKCKFSNEELIKRYDRAHPRKVLKESKSFSIGRKKKSDLQCDTSLVYRTETINDLNPLASHAASVKVCDPYGAKAGSHGSPPVASSDTFEEIDMEWEAIENEEVLLNIKEHRQQFQDARNIYLQPMEMMETNCLDLSEDSSKDCLIVLDTNILISQLKFVEELSEKEYKGMGHPLLVIPWMVLRELDALKGGRDVTKFCGSKLSHKARLASHFINKCFSSQHPRVKGQSALDDKDHLIAVDVPDDNILNCCLQLQKKGQRVILLSNDVNFCNKAMATGILSYGKERMVKILNLDGQRLTDALMNSSPGLPLKEQDHLKQTAHSSVSCKEPPELTVSTKFESLFQDFLTKLIEAEMIRVYDEMWIRVVLLKPPWTVVDALSCLSKHWIAVFSCIMSRPAQNIIQNLLNVFKKKESCEDSIIDDLEKVMQTAINLCDTIHLGCYQSLSSEYKIHFQLLLKALKEYNLNEDIRTFQDYMDPKVIPLTPGNPAGQSESNPVLEVFQHIWDLMNEFCGITCDILGIGHSISYKRPQSFPSVAEVKGRLPEALNCVSSLVNCLSSILETAGSCLSVNTPAIVTLLSVIQAMVPTELLFNKDISVEKILEFCVQDSYRLLLLNGLRQFQEAQLLLIKVTESSNWGS